MSENKPVNRKRNQKLTIRLSIDEYEEFISRVESTNLTKQQYVLDAILRSTIISDYKLTELREIAKMLGDYASQLRGIGTNMNQMAKIANQTGKLKEEKALLDAVKEVDEVKHECEKLYKEVREVIGTRRVCRGEGHGDQ